MIKVRSVPKRVGKKFDFIRSKVFVRSFWDFDIFSGENMILAVILNIDNKDHDLILMIIFLF